MIRLIIALIIFSSCSNNIDKLEETKIMHNSSIRTFYTYEPLNLEKNMTLIVGLHGYTGTANTFITFCIVRLLVCGNAISIYITL